MICYEGSAMRRIVRHHRIYFHKHYLCYMPLVFVLPFYLVNNAYKDNNNADADNNGNIQVTILRTYVVACMHVLG